MMKRRLFRGKKGAFFVWFLVIMTAGALGTALFGLVDKYGKVPPIGVKQIGMILAYGEGEKALLYLLACIVVGTRKQLSH